MKKIFSSLVLALLTVGVCSAQSTLYFPQFVDGTQDQNSVVWWTTIGVSNPADPGSPIASGTITLTNNDGTPMNITLFDLSGKAGNTFQLAGGQTKVFLSPSTGSPAPRPLVAGFATVTSNLPVVGFLTFLEGGPYGTNQQPGKLTPISAVDRATTSSWTIRWSLPDTAASCLRTDAVCWRRSKAIGELPIAMQADLLRVLQNGEVRRIGGAKA